MNALLGLKLDKPSFLHWVQKQERRYELKDGEVIMHPGGSKRHAWLVGAFVAAFRERLDLSIWSVGPADIAVEVGADIRYPDVVVERSQHPEALSTSTPSVVVEVLSPSSVGIDLTVKLAEYTSIASLEAYIVASQDAAICWVWQRGGDDRAFPSKPQELAGADAAIDLAALGISLPLAEIYRGIA